MTMTVCYELGKDENEVANWSYDDLIRWHAFFRLKNEIEAKQMKRLQEQNPRSTPSGMGPNVQVFVE